MRKELLGGEKQTVTVLSIEERLSKEGKDFRVVIVEGVPTVYTRSDGSSYTTKVKVGIPSNLPKTYLDTLIGKELPGKIIKEECEPYEWFNPDTWEEVTLNYKYKYVAVE